MLLNSRCTRCQRSLRVLARHEGKTLHCPGCAAPFLVLSGDAVAGTLDEPSYRERPGIVAEPVRAAEALPEAPGRLVLPWMLLAPAALALALRLWAGHGMLWPTLGVALGSLCLLVGQRGHWPISRRVAASLSLALLGHGLTLASSLGSAPEKAKPAPVKSAGLVLGPVHHQHPPSQEASPLLASSPTAEALMKSRLQLHSFQAISRDLQTSTRLGELLTLSICTRPNGGSTALATTADGYLKEFSYPVFGLRAVYRLQGTGYRAVADGRRGNLWVAACTPANLRANHHGDQPRGRADLHVYRIPHRAEDRSAAPRSLSPDRVLPLDSDVLELLISPDHEALFYLAQNDNGVRLGRIDGERQAVDREVSLQAIRIVCLTEDGKTLYAAGNGSVLVFDPTTLEMRRRIEVQVDVRALAATNDGCVYLGEQGQWTRLTRLDLSGEQPGIHQWPARLHGRIYMKLAPDQHRLYVGTSSPITEQIDSLLVRGHQGTSPLVLAIAVSSSEGRVQGEFFLTPDGRFLVNRWGTVFRLAQASEPAAVRKN